MGTPMFADECFMNSIPNAKRLSTQWSSLLLLLHRYKPYTLRNAVSIFWHPLGLVSSPSPPHKKNQKPTNPRVYGRFSALTRQAG